MNIYEVPRFMTPQESLWVGSTLPNINKKNAYTPIIVTEDGMRPNFAHDMRKLIVNLPGNTGILIGIQETLVFSLEDLVRGKTIRDPRLLGYIDGNTGAVVEILGRDLNAEYRKALLAEEARTGIRYFLR